MSTERKYFGTDGIRGRVGEAPVTADFILKLGWAAGRVFAIDGRSKVLIGKDTRISGYMFESALEAGLSTAGVDVRLLGPMPTPAIAYLTQTLHAQAGIVISASHNPYKDNGIKFFGADGMKLPDSVEMEIEAALSEPMRTVSSRELGRAERVEDAPGRYIEFCKSTIPFGMSLKSLKIVVDCANGATYHVAPNVFSELGAEVISIGVSPDGYNINEACGSTFPDGLVASVKENRADVGIALDGDGDRVIMVDHRGEVVDGDELLFIIAESRLRDKTLKGAVVGTLMSNFGLEEALKERGIELKRSQVGDRYVLEMMKEGAWTLGGETSGHIICLDRQTTGDGITAALQVLAAMQMTGKSLFELKQGMQRYPQILINVRMRQHRDVLSLPLVKEAVKRAEEALSDNGRVLLRASGTEPVLRVMVEGKDRTQIEGLGGQLANTVELALG